MRKLILAGMEISGRDCVICALQEDGEFWELRVIPREKHSVLQNIYVGQVENISPNMNAAFVRISPEERCFFPLKEEPYLIYACEKKNGSSLKNGDQILVQVKKEAMKGKLATVTARLSIAGRYLALTTGEKAIGISQKLPAEIRENLKNEVVPILCERYSDTFGIVLRTNAASAEPSWIVSEAEKLAEQINRIRDRGVHRTLYSCLYKPEPEELAFVRDFFRAGQTVIVTDLPDVYVELKDFVAVAGSGGSFRYFEDKKNMDVGNSENAENQLRLYEDPLLPLYRLYSMEGLLGKALEERVWLKSGAFLVIQQTEACTVIDVNTGKNIRKMDSEEAALQVNLEAAKEAAIQMRLRNLSGIVLIDFINLKEQEHRDLVTETLSDFLRKDPDSAAFVDMTALQLAEVTRRKARKPLAEVIKDLTI